MLSDNRRSALRADRSKNAEARLYENTSAPQQDFLKKTYFYAVFFNFIRKGGFFSRKTTYFSSAARAKIPRRIMFFE
jgi:hypothetical protein